MFIFNTTEKMDKRSKLVLGAQRNGPLKVSFQKAM